ncbi:sulfite exporter TauE/SafE family protein [Thiosocius teredinicola]|uniref:sulfite exporter TauE/SafE family protein n=1 Tax=Thiosocius teredinicola TaxID=1973002 RepID=UPI000990AF90
MDLPMLLGAGAVAGTLAGLLGIGGGVIIVPIVTLLFERQGIPANLAIKMAVGTSLATIVVTAISSIYTHHRKGAVDWGLFKIMGPSVFVGSLVGAWLADLIPGEIMYIAFVVFLFAVSVQMAMSRVAAHRPLPSTPGLASVSTFVGISSALMGIGGGAMHVPFLSYCGIPVKRAIATAAAVGLPLSASATAGFIIGGLDEQGMPAGSLGYVNLPVFGGVVGASLLFAPLGATLAHKLPDLLLRRLFSVFLFLLATRMAFNLF